MNAIREKIQCQFQKWSKFRIYRFCFPSLIRIQLFEKPFLFWSLEWWKYSYIRDWKKRVVEKTIIEQRMRVTRDYDRGLVLVFSLPNCVEMKWSVQVFTMEKEPDWRKGSSVINENATELQPTWNDFVRCYL